MDDIDRKYSRHSTTILGKCKFKDRRGVYCDAFSDCTSCGWNPVVEARRKEQTRRRMKIYSSQKPVQGEKWYIGSGPFK